MTGVVPDDAWTFNLYAIALLLPVCLIADDPVPEAQLPQQLVGTWKMVSAKYNGIENPLPAQMEVIKHVTPTHMTWFRADPDSGEVVSMASGRWSIDGDRYSEVPDRGMSEDF